jgi:hypothetical protein
MLGPSPEHLGPLCATQLCYINGRPRRQGLHGAVRCGAVRCGAQGRPPATSHGLRRLQLCRPTASRKSVSGKLVLVGRAPCPTRTARRGAARRGAARRARPDQTRPDQTRPDQTRPDQTVSRYHMYLVSGGRAWPSSTLSATRTCASVVEARVALAALGLLAPAPGPSRVCIHSDNDAAIQSRASCNERRIFTSSRAASASTSTTP